MKHKKLLIALSIIAAIPMAFAFTACDDSAKNDPPITNQEHKHSGETWKQDETSHWKVCDECGETFAMEAHNLEMGVCSVCGYFEKFTSGLKFVLDEESDTYMVAGINNRWIEEIVIPSYYQGKLVTSIGDESLQLCDHLTSITIPDSVTTIGVYAFYKCESLTSITIPNSVKIIKEKAFQNCKSLTSITFPDSVTTIGSEAFTDCDSLTRIKIPDSVTTIGFRAFSDTAYYKNERNWDEAGILYIGNHLIEIRDAISGDYQIKDGTKTIGSRAFSYFESLTSVTIPDSVTTIGFGAFTGCKSLTSVTLGKSVTTIGESAFHGCSSLTSIEIPNSVTTIGNYAFGYCKSLTSIEIPDSVTTIGYRTFYGCADLTEISYQGTIQQWNEIQKEVFLGWGWDSGSSIKTIHCKGGDITL